MRALLLRHSVAIVFCMLGVGILEIHLNRLAVDKLVMVGTSTSGCVRATAVDAFYYGCRVFLVEGGCLDRAMFLNAVSLFDMDAKYAKVFPKDYVINALDSKVE